MGEEEGKSLYETPTWAVATVITGMVSVGFLVHGSLKRFAKWLIDTRRKALLAALEKIKEAELMLFGLLSLLMGHWTIWVSKICIKSSVLSSRFYPCTVEGYNKISVPRELIVSFDESNYSVLQQHKTVRHEYCPEGSEPFASYESLEQLHRLLFVLGIVHICYNFVTVALAMLKRLRVHFYDPCSCRYKAGTHGRVEQSSWLLIYENHELHLSYDFHSYMLRSMEEEFRGIVGISFQFIVADHTTLDICHIVYILELPCGNQVNLRDELFWFGKPRLLLWSIQLISFQNAFEMATFIWSLWEIRRPSCFIENRVFLIIRLISGYITFPLYVIITQMGSKFKKTVVAEEVRESLHGWCQRARRSRKRHAPFASLMTATSTASLNSMVDESVNNDTEKATSKHDISSIIESQTNSPQQIVITRDEICEQPIVDEDSYSPSLQ
ncbi:hypothetical protein Sjap_009959 [Stephania japonica]|uniref:MLO-like protein n=1 Tax=Stephania japonica TaxID=461633 RepID=A0AAP0P378_9MAGN